MEASEFWLCHRISHEFLGKPIDSWQNSWANANYIRKSARNRFVQQSQTPCTKYFDTMLECMQWNIWWSFPGRLQSHAASDRIAPLPTKDGTLKINPHCGFESNSGHFQWPAELGETQNKTSTTHSEMNMCVPTRWSPLKLLWTGKSQDKKLCLNGARRIIWSEGGMLQHALQPAKISFPSNVCLCRLLLQPSWGSCRSHLVTLASAPNRHKLLGKTCTHMRNRKEENRSFYLESFLELPLRPKLLQN